MNEDQLKFQLDNWVNMKKLFQHMSSPEGLKIVRQAQKSIKTESLLLVGAYDRVIPAKHTLNGFHRYIPDGLSTYMFENSGHLPFEEEQDLFIQKVLEFVKK